MHWVYFFSDLLHKFLHYSVIPSYTTLMSIEKFSDETNIAVDFSLMEILTTIIYYNLKAIMIISIANTIVCLKKNDS